MDWAASVDNYCERLGPGYWAEPINAVTNLAFILAGLWAVWSMRCLDVKSRALWALTALTFCIGIGSFLFHTHAQLWSGLADVLPIWSFVLLYIATCIHVIGGVAPWRVAGIMLALVAVLALLVALAASGADRPAEAPRSWTNGSEQYLPAVAAMLFFSGLTLYRRHPLRIWFTAATALFFVSLGFRTWDVHICDTLPIGTHFMWHMLNGAMLALLLQALIRHRALSA